MSSAITTDASGFFIVNSSIDYKIQLFSNAGSTFLVAPITSASYQLGSGSSDVYQLNTMGMGSTALGGNYADFITGSGDDDTINGGGGNDTITGGVGADTLMVVSMSSFASSLPAGAYAERSDPKLSALDAAGERVRLAALRGWQMRRLDVGALAP